VILTGRWSINIRGYGNPEYPGFVYRITPSSAWHLPQLVISHVHLLSYFTFPSSHVVTFTFFVPLSSTIYRVNSSCPRTFHYADHLNNCMLLNPLTGNPLNTQLQPILVTVSASRRRDWLDPSLAMLQRISLCWTCCTICGMLLNGIYEACP